MLLTLTAVAAILAALVWGLDRNAPLQHPVIADYPTPNPALLLPSHSPTGRIEWLHANGNRLVDESGTTLALRGVNIENRAWTSSTNPSIAYEIRAIPEATSVWGANLVVLSISSGPINRRDPVYLDDLDRMVSLAKANRAYVLVIYRSAEPNGDQPAMPNQAAQDAMAYLALRYTNEPAVLYGLQVEPHDVSWDTLKPRLVSMIDAIRATNPRSLIAVPGTNWSSEVYWALNDPIVRTGLIYDAHVYDHWGTVVSQYQLTKVAARYPLLIGEFGVGSRSTVQDVTNLLNLAEANGMSWAAWQFNDHGCPCLLSSDVPFTPNNYGQEIRLRLTLANVMTVAGVRPSP